MRPYAGNLTLLGGRGDPAAGDDRRAAEPGPTYQTGRQAGSNGAAVTGGAGAYLDDEIPF